jgi:flavin-binding protein dodecin
MTEERKHAILFAATILAARKLSDIGTTPWSRECAITEAIEKANHILEKIDAKWPADSRAPESLTASR